MIEPFVQDADFTLYCGDALEVLRELPDESVHMCATSPPFWGLRDYQCEGQIGLERSIDEWVESLVAVFGEVRRVLRQEGACFIEIGDSFTDKQLVGQPWRLAFALQRAGWFLRSEIIWARLRSNPMPESVTDRPTKSHSTVFLLSKSARYFFDQEAVREAYEPTTIARQRYAVNDMRSGSVEHDGRVKAPTGAATVHRHDLIRPREPPQAETLDGSNGEAPRGPDGRRATTVTGGENSEQHRDGERWPNSGRNIRSVWTIATEPTPFAHFATWPQKLVERMVLAGCPDGGTVLDPFAGSGTTSLVARRLGRRSIGIELSPEYAKLAAKRLQQLSLFAEPA